MEPRKGRPACLPGSHLVIAGCPDVQPQQCKAEPDTLFPPQLWSSLLPPTGSPLEHHELFIISDKYLMRIILYMTHYDAYLNNA